MKNYGIVEHPKDVATKEYVDGCAGIEKPWELLENITIEEEVATLVFNTELLSSKKELHIEGYIIPTDTTITNQAVQFNNGAPVWQTSANCKATGKVYICMDIYKSPRGSTVYDGTMSAYDYILTGGSTLKMTKMPNELADIEVEGLYLGNFSLRTTAANPMAVGTRIKVWGR